MITLHPGMKEKDERYVLGFVGMNVGNRPGGRKTDFYIGPRFCFSLSTIHAMRRARPSSVFAS